MLTELEQYHYAELRNVVAITGLFNAHIDVLQVKKKHEHGEAPIVVKWQKQFEGKDIAFHILTGPTADEIVMDFVEVAKTTLIAITTHHKSLLRRAFMYSLSQQLLFHTKIPPFGLRGKK